MLCSGGSRKGLCDGVRRPRLIAVLLLLASAKADPAEDQLHTAAAGVSNIVVEPPAVEPSPAANTNNLVLLKPARAVPGVSSSALMQKAWKAWEKQQYDEVFAIADECSKRFTARAAKQQAALEDFAPKERTLNYGALNDVATCLFIKGKSLREMRRYDEAKEVFREILRNYRFAQCWDPKGWFWKVADAAQDEINCIEYGVDFGDYTSETLTRQAWKAYKAGRYDAMELYVRKCVDLYGDTARKMQSSLEGFAPKGEENDYWALNDVGTCLFVRAKALQKQRRNREAALVYKEILDTYSYAQCWDPNGWYWKLSEESRRNLAFCSG
jgi:tetratricopeptide (TPR) repeat protein